MRKVIYNEAQLIKEKLYEISDYIYNNPELGNQEYKAVEALTRFLKEHGFEIECPYAGMDTAFKATLDRKSTRLNSSHYQQSRMPSSA